MEDGTDILAPVGLCGVMHDGVETWRDRFMDEQIGAMRGLRQRWRPHRVAADDDAAATILNAITDGVSRRVIYTERNGVLRIISARRATRAEHDEYHKQAPSR